MNIALSTFEETELSISPEDLPNFRLSKDADIQDDTILKNQSPMEAAKAFAVDLQNALKTKNEDDLFYLYDRKFNKISEHTFKNAPWPAIEEIEQTDETLEFDMNTIYLYNELCYRHIYARLTNIDAEVRIKSFGNYIDLFETFLHSKDDVVLPVPWIWDILDEFVYQFQTFCQLRAKMKEDDPNLQLYLNLDENENIWNLETVVDLLQKLISKSGVIKAGKNELEEPNQSTKTRQYFGYYSIVSLLRLYVLVSDFPAALKVIEPIDFKKLHIFTRSLSCLLTLFYYAGFTYLVSQRYRESVKLFELILSCFSKYKQFYSKSFQSDAMLKQADRCIFLLAIALAFYPCSIDETVSETLKERLQDKINKINKYDTLAFSDAFNYGCPKLIIPIKDKDHFATFGFDKNFMEPVQSLKETVSAEFTQIRELNNLRGVLKLYSTIKLDKLAAVLKKDNNQLQELIKLYRARNNVEPKANPFEQTIIKRLIESTAAIDFVVEGDTVKVKDTLVQPNFSKLFYKNINKIEDMTREIQAL